LTDIVSPEERSKMMAGIRGRDTKPELLVRKALFRQGFRYRLNNSHLPGKPDILFPRYRAAILIHGCFWHGHDCEQFRWPKTRTEFWRDKITGNKERDSRTEPQLRKLGWRTLVVWECAIKGKHRLLFDEMILRVAGWLRGEQEEMTVRGSDRPCPNVE
jgi:DNA mismatch endonuclease (patch repair protein)